MKIVSKVKSLALATALLGGVSFFPGMAGAENLGWSQDEGYADPTISHDEDSAFADSGFTVYAAASKPQSHTAKVIVTDPVGTISYIHAVTKWKDKYHYTRARWEIGDTIKGDSNRQWGTNQSTANSGKHSDELSRYIAHSYWGS
ncbi:hypothetical protein [Peribacillus butanolivorans]|uniref:hypothetical protein n=1 Tax=Peribacillus butanolivorans TaxID=421767 RepID=UPI0035D777D1